MSNQAHLWKDSIFQATLGNSWSCPLKFAWFNLAYKTNSVIAHQLSDSPNIQTKPLRIISDFITSVPDNIYCNS